MVTEKIIHIMIEKSENFLLLMNLWLMVLVDISTSLELQDIRNVQNIANKRMIWLHQES